MVKVISTVPHKTVVKEIVCKNCGSTLEYTPADVHEREWRDYCNDLNVTSSILCPTCSHDVIVGCR